MTLNWAASGPAVLLLLSVATPARAEDGTALVNKMEAAYAALKSYSQTMTATGVVVIEGSTSSGTVNSRLAYKAPNQLYVSLYNRASGQITVATDGRQQAVHLAKKSTVARKPAPATLKEFLAGLKAYRIVAVLDPLYFLAGGSASDLAEGFEAKGEESVKGSACDRVVGTLKRNAVATARSGTITFWIDKKTSLLRKMHLDLKGVPLRAMSSEDPASGPRVSMSLSDQSLVETVQKLEIDPPLKDADLRVTVPPGTRELRPRRSP
jgi:outer membrane lipoprotein-sorting protein